MRTLRNAVAALVILSSIAAAQYCPSCIQNSAAPQIAQFNVSSATVRGPLTVGSLVMSTMSVSTMTAGVFIGSGTSLTDLTASQLLRGTVPSARLSGSYPGIVGVGVLSSATWHGDVIGTQYGGTGQNFVTALQGSIPYFTATGVLGTLATSSAGKILQTGGAGADPAWTSSPTVSGVNVYPIPMANLTSGQLPSGITVPDTAISSVSAAKVYGNIPGNATNITGILQMSQLSTGTLATSQVASSITVTGVAPGWYGGGRQIVLMNVRPDGRVSSISQSSFTVPPPVISSGTLPADVFILAQNVSSGTLLPGVIASSLNATGVTPGAYGSSARTIQLTVAGDGRLSSVSQPLIQLPPGQVTAGTLPGSVVVLASAVANGNLGSGVIASSIAATGVTPGAYGGSGTVPAFTVGYDGRISTVTLYSIPGLSTSVVMNNVDNGWTATQTFFSSITAQAIGGTTVTASNVVSTNVTVTGGFFGSGLNVSSVQPSNLIAGSLTPGVTISSAYVTGLVNQDSIVTTNSSPTWSGYHRFLRPVSFEAVGGSTYSVVASSRIYAPSASFGSSSTGFNLVVEGPIESRSNSGAAGLLGNSASSSPGDAPGVTSQRSRGTLTSPSPLLQGDTILLHEADGYDGVSFKSSGALKFTAAEIFSAGVRGTNFSIALTTPGANDLSSPQLFVGGSGKVGIGTVSPAAKLHLSSGAVLVDGTSAALTVNGLVTASSANINGATLILSPTAGEYVLYATTSTNNGGLVVFGAGTTCPGCVQVGTPSAGGIGTPTAGLNFQTLGSARVGSSNVSGGVSNPLFTQNPNSPAVNNGRARFGLRVGTTANGIINMGSIVGLVENVTTADGALVFETSQASTTTERARINSAGNFGVGTASPTARIHISSGGLYSDGTSAAITSISSVNASAFFGDGQHLTGVPSTGSIVGVYVQKAGDSISGALNFGAAAAINMSGSSITLNTAGGVGATILAGSSITGTAFFGDGQHLTGIPSTGSIVGVYVQRAGDSMTGPLTLAGSSLTLTGAGGNIITNSSMTASALFGNGDGLTSITRSSCTVVPNSNFTNTTFGVALATVTITTRGFNVKVMLTAIAENTNANNTQSTGVLVDGAFTSNLGSAALSAYTSTGAGFDGNVSFPGTRVTGLSAGTHTFGLVLKTTANTGTLLNDSTHYTAFCADEAP